MEREDLKSILVNDTLIKNLVIGLQAMIQAGKGSVDTVYIYSQFKKEMVFLLFSASENDKKINESVINLKKYYNHSIQPGRPGSLLAYIINIIRENDFVVQNKIESIVGGGLVLDRNKNIKKKLSDLLDVEVADVSGSDEEKQEKTQDIEKRIWNGAANDSIATQTIEAILKDTVLTELFGEVFDSIKKGGEMKLFGDESVSPINIDTDLEDSEVQKILKTFSIESKISSKISSIEAKIAGSGGGCNGKLLNINSEKPLNIKGIYGIGVNHDDMNFTINGNLSIKKNKAILSGVDGDIVVDISTEKERLEERKKERKNVITKQPGRKIVNLCHSKIVIDSCGVKCYAKGDDCCVDNVFKMIGYHMKNKKK